MRPGEPKNFGGDAITRQANETLRTVSVRKIRKFLPLFFLGFFSLAILTHSVIFLTPNTFINTFVLKINVNYLFFISLFVSIYSVFSLVLKNNRRGFFIASFIVSYLILRMLNLTHFFFFLIVLLLFASLELFFSYNK